MTDKTLFPMIPTFWSSYFSTTSSTGSSKSDSLFFVGEELLQEQLPNYNQEYIQLNIILSTIIVLFACSILLPYLLSSTKRYKVITTIKTIECEKVADEKNKVSKGNTRSGTVPNYTTTTTTNCNHNTDEGNNDRIINTKEHIRTKRIRNVPKYSYLFTMILCYLLMKWLHYVLVNTSNNTYSPRRVYLAPLFTKNECQMIIEMSERAARKNIDISHTILDEYEIDSNEYKRAQLVVSKEPIGWQKVRHNDYPTTDLNVWTDPYTYSEREWIRSILDTRLAPLLSRIYGIPEAAIQAHDLFVVKYNGDDDDDESNDTNSSSSTKRAALEKHTDGGDISVSMYLNDDFTGGGTRFWNRYTNEPFIHIDPNSSNVGDIITFPASIQHEGYPITSGTRYIMVAFLDIVPSYSSITTSTSSSSSNPMTTTTRTVSTGISPFATYFNRNWLHRRLETFYVNHITKISRKYFPMFVRKLIPQLILGIETFTDRTAAHEMVRLVHPNHTDKYIRLLLEQQEQQEHCTNNNNDCYDVNTNDTATTTTSAKATATLPACIVTTTKSITTAISSRAGKPRWWSTAYEQEHQMYLLYGDEYEQYNIDDDDEYEYEHYNIDNEDGNE